MKKNTLPEQYDINRLTDHLFRHESGKMVSVLTKIFGIQNLETAEDVVQQTFIDAMSVWKLKGIPSNPSGWLFRVAKNKLGQIEEKKKLEPFYLYHALLGEIYSRLNDPLLANEYFETAMRLTRSDAEKKILKEKIIAKMN